jgi:hypothetical protein
MAKETGNKPGLSKQKRGFPLGEIIIIVIVLVMVAGALLYFRVPQKIGLVKTAADRLFTMTPDREKAAALFRDMEQAGFDMKGVEVYVLPVKGTDDNVAMFVLDASKGFDFTRSGGGDPFKKFVQVVSEAQAQGINRAAVAYYNEDGRLLLAATLPAEAAVSYAQGKLTDEQLVKKVNIGTDDLTGLVGEIQKQLQ